MWKYCFRSAAGWALDEQKSTCEWTCALPTLVVQRSAVFLNHSSAGILSLLRNLLWLLFIYFNLFDLEFILFSALTQSSTLASFSGLPLPDISLVLNQDFPTSLLPPPPFFLILIFQLFSTNSNVGFQFLTLNAQNGHLAYILHPQALSPGWSWTEQDFLASTFMQVVQESVSAL